VPPSVVTIEDVGNPTETLTVTLSSDFSGTGEDSILWRNASGDTALWNANGSGGFTGEDLGVVPASWSVHKIFA
jgi:hypothetical protein